MVRDKVRLIESLKRRGYISKEEVIKAMEKVDRKLFVPRYLINHAYVDMPLEIGLGQTISAPHMVGIMVENLDLKKGQKILEIGAGSGYHAAVVAEIVKPGKVYSVEIHDSLANRAKKNLALAKIKNVVVIVGDGSKGLPQDAPFERIFVTCGAPNVPEPLVEQLKENGKLLIPVGSRFNQVLILVEKREGKIKKSNLGGCMFVPLVGEYGFTR